MNRIETLSLEAAKFAANTTHVVRAGAGVMQAYNNKFAELLIRECNTQVVNYVAVCGEVSSIPDYVILEHFGIC